MSCHRLATRALACALLFSVLSAALSAQSFDRIQRQRAQQMLTNLRNELKKTYYDATFGGADIDAHFVRASEKIDKAASYGQALAIIAQAFVDLNDSHTRFIPPALSTTVEYGWQMQMVGDTCFVTAVRPGSDAHAKGLTAGDRILSIDGFKPTRNELWKLQYAYYTVRPRAAVSLVVQAPGGEPRTVEAVSRVTKGRRVLDLTSTDSADFNALVRDIEREARAAQQTFYRFDTAVIWKVPTFDFGPDEVDRIVDEVTKGTKAMVLDLRGNPGGQVKTLERFVSRFFDRDVTIAQLKGRTPMPPMVAKNRGRVFAGDLVVLIDGRSSSAAEIFARVVQLEKRGVVLGDRSAGAVMQSRIYSGEMGVDSVTFYGATITDADVIMTDGGSLERTGVTPDEIVLPTGADLAGATDPALVKAAARVGVTLEPRRAAALFPITWR
jgi:C-terminal processing protease CtpA/Prc